MKFMRMQGHRKSKGQKKAEPWPRKQILRHTEGKCPWCKKHCRNLEIHVSTLHKFGKNKRKVELKGIVHGHD